jgi:hypothetical protein
MAQEVSKYDKALIRSIAKSLDSINGYKELFCQDVIIQRDQESHYKNCSYQEKDKIKSNQLKAYEMIETWLKKIKSYEETYNIEKTKVTKYRAGRKVKYSKQVSSLQAPIKVLKCISKKIKKASFMCNSKAKACRNGGVLAFVNVLWPIADPFFYESDIHLCKKSFWQGETSELATIIHEISHQCGTVDGSYLFSKRYPPKNDGGVKWFQNAETYAFWVEKEFCIPDIDC